MEPQLFLIPQQGVLPATANKTMALDNRGIIMASHRADIHQTIREIGRGIVCKLHGVLCGLKQSPRAWFERFSLAMKKHDFKQSNADHTLFLKHREGMVTALIIYVKDVIIAWNDE
ncbi:hypothetical protein RJ640_020498 [Escallonia rubra]|uniref:Reverse transcriptase Ty1/copia-type domain-containing protein n=1 Tax=Escallonia rubra TaxID=112253 RepID=A0AA88RKN6_9ASTE|nr:hypothetical protein RJ640_020498 [Escallonia rubra]